MPVTRSRAGEKSASGAETTEPTTATATTSYGTATTSAEQTTVETTNDADQAASGETADRVHQSKPATKATSGKKSSRLQLLRAKAELAQLRAEAAAARVAAMEAEQEEEEEEEDASSVTTEADTRQRVQSWLHTTKLIAIDNRPFQPAGVQPEPQPPTEIEAPVVTAAPWSNPATAPAGVVTTSPHQQCPAAGQPVRHLPLPETTVPASSTPAGGAPPVVTTAWPTNLACTRTPVSNTAWPSTVATKPVPDTAWPANPAQVPVSNTAWPSKDIAAATGPVSNTAWSTNRAAAPVLAGNIAWAPNEQQYPAATGLAHVQQPSRPAASWEPYLQSTQPAAPGMSSWGPPAHQNLDGATAVQHYRPDHREPGSVLRSIELPRFNGAHQDWLVFRAAYNQTARLLDNRDNMARLERSLKGAAYEAVRNLFISSADPSGVMKTLEMRFGRPETIVTTELERLRTLPRLTESAKELCIFATQVQNVVAAIEATGFTTYLYNPEISKCVVEKLTPTLKRLWCEYNLAQPRDEPELVKVGRFITREAEIYSQIAPPEEIVSERFGNDVRPRRPQRIHAVNEQQPKCCLCDEQEHNAVDCQTFKRASVDERWDMAKKQRLCFRCLRPRNKAHNCRGKKCNVGGCPGTHHKLLHHPRPNKTAEKVNSAWAPQVALLKIAPVRVSGPAGAVDTFALLDDGSTVTLIDAELANNIGAKGPEEPLHVATYDGESGTHERSCRVAFTARGANKKKERIQARTVRNLRLATQHLPRGAVENCAHLKSIAGQLHYEDAKPKILIGQDNWHLLLASEVRTGRRSEPVASLTPLGWVIHGSHTRSLGHSVNFIKRADDDDHLDNVVRNYIALDNLYVDPKRPRSDPDEKALRLLEEHTQRTPEGKLRTALLWRSEQVKLPNNYGNTLRRLLNIERKIDRDPDLKRRYTEQMEALVAKGYAEPAPPSTQVDRTWYLPHFAVFNPAKPEKLRVVHDAAAKTRGVSLNDQLLTGPDLLQPLPGILMRFRQYPIAVTADIAEMFMQVELREQDRDALRYLWRGDRRDDAPPEQYRMKSLIFGASCSPATAIFAMNRNAEQYKTDHPEAVEAIRTKHYMDDYLDSFEDIDKAAKITKAVRDIHRRANFVLTKWTSNSPALLQALGETEERTQVNLQESTKTERVLGLIWKPVEDELAFNLDLARVPPAILQEETPTKRQALQIVMSLFDPLGLASPVTIRAKQILQEVWRRGTNWDEKLEPDLSASWVKWLTHLKGLSNVSIPRSYPCYASATSLQLHVFTDASEAAYATALYWRTVTSDGRVDVTLIVAKAKVAPLKVTSIPRLELQAAVLGTRMAAAVKKEHERQPESTTYWSDSRTTLTWIQTGSRSYKPYVAHRIAAIEENSTANEWRWIPTKDNVADDATRDVPDKFDTEHRWFQGPAFLLGNPETWPGDRKIAPITTGEERTNVVMSQTSRQCLREGLPDVERFSSWRRYLRSAARVLQFIELCRRSTERVHYRRTKRNKSSDPDWRRTKTATPASKPKIRTLEADRFRPLTAELQKRAEDHILQASQQDAFQEELRLLKQERQLPRHSRLFTLSIELCEDIIRLKSRIGATSGITDEMMKPVVVDGEHRAIKLWIEHVHRQLHHAGVETTVNECRQQLWVLRLRPITRMIIHRCFLCQMRRASPPEPATGDLPLCRLAHHRRPFSYTGMDYFGPLTITVGRTRQKRYVAIFTCLTTRAIHLELVTSLSTDSAVMALRRMIARRGCPTQLWSDNGTNFRGADKELRDAVFKATEEEASKKTIDWRFIPPGAPFMGGAWERMVRSVKTALATVLNERYPQEEVLHTLLIEAEHTVNSRPLTHVSVSADDPEALTPNHFILGGSGRVSAPGVFTDKDLDHRSSWRSSQRLADMFWARWLKEYLPELRNRRTPHGRGPSLEVGDLVLIVDGNLPRNMWIRGRISATYPGPDGVVRAVDVATKSGVLRRPAKKIVVIPVDIGAPAHRSRDPAPE